MAENGNVKHFLQLATEEAANAVISNKGGPFGAIVVKDGAIVSKAHNLVFETNDPTAHTKFGTFKLDGCVLYSSCQPCPMCFGACLWARLEKVYYACDEFDAAKFGFDDSLFYEIIVDKKKREEVAVCRPYEGSLHPFQLWEKKQDKVKY